MALNGGDSTPASTVPAFIAVKIFEVVPVPMKATSQSSSKPFLLTRKRARVSVDDPIAVMPIILPLTSDIVLISGFDINQNEGLIVRKPTTLTGSPRAAPAITCDCAPEKSISPVVSAATWIVD